jgi:hypothetical protein
MTIATSPRRTEPLASKTHTLGALLLVLTLGVVSRILMTGVAGINLSHLGNAQIYLIGLATEWVYFTYVYFGVRRGPNAIRQIIDEARWSAARFGVYAAIAAAAAVVWVAFGFVLGRVFHAGHSARGLLPYTPLQMGLWIVLS